MKWSFDARIRRAAELASRYPAAADLLAFYRELAIFQKPIFETLQSQGETDVHALVPYFPPLMELVDRCGPEGLSGKGERLPQSGVASGGLGRRRRARFGSRSLRQILCTRAAPAIR